jgi:hypothetical protein
MWQAGVGDGRIRVIELHKNDDQARETVEETIGRLEMLRGHAQSLGGTLIVEEALPEIKTRLNSSGTLGSTGLMQRIKTQLDPHGILSPGRFDSERGTSVCRGSLG